ncbi:MAG: ADP-ribosylglycohydrolase family protein [Thermotogaceae bacterium]|nr:ADP-ribosylglycohydrolase family protein [Thermotogaceae bacterium]
MSICSKLKGGLWGVIVGDSFGFTHQMMSRCLDRDFREVGEIHTPYGLWSDDSSLTLATADALIEGYDVSKIAKNFVQWFYDGEFTPRGFSFDHGRTTKKAIRRIARGIPPLEAGGDEEWDNGNGSLMRILPVVFYTYFNINNKHERLRVIHEVSKITHAHPRTLMGCGIYSLMIWNILDGVDKMKSYHKSIEESKEIYSGEYYLNEWKHYERILSGNIHEFGIDDIKGSGYVVHTLEAALWAFLRTSGFEEAVKEVVSLGGDADTTGAVTGGLAGTYYGLEAIPRDWIGRIERKGEVESIIESFVDSLPVDLEGLS